MSKKPVKKAKCHPERAAYGGRGLCKRCYSREAVARWRRENPARYTKTRREWYQKNREKILAQQKERYPEWYPKNRERILAQQRERYKKKRSIFSAQSISQALSNVRGSATEAMCAVSQTIRPDLCSEEVVSAIRSTLEELDYPDLMWRIVNLIESATVRAVVSALYKVSPNKTEVNDE